MVDQSGLTMKRALAGLPVEVAVAVVAAGLTVEVIYKGGCEIVQLLK